MKHSDTQLDHLQSQVDMVRAYSDTGRVEFALTAKFKKKKYDKASKEAKELERIFN